MGGRVPKCFLLSGILLRYTAGFHVIVVLFICSIMISLVYNVPPPVNSIVVVSKRGGGDPL